MHFYYKITVKVSQQKNSVLFGAKKMIGCRESAGTMLSYKRLEDANWKMNVEVFIMNNKLQAKDLINLGLFTVLYFVIGCCVAIPIGFVPIFLPVL